MSYKKTFFWIISFVLAVFALIGAYVVNYSDLQESKESMAAGTVYYVSSTGNDSNDGKSESAPWKTLAKINGSGFLAGDKILLKKGDSWIGNLAISSSGSSGNPILVGSYGNGNAPIISNPGTALKESTGCSASVPNTGKMGVSIRGDYVTVENLHISNVGESCVHIYAESENAIIRNNELDNCGIGVKVYGHNSRAHNNNIHDLTLVNAGYGAVGVWFFGSDNQFDHNIVARAFIDECTPYGTEGGGAEIWTSGQTASAVNNIRVEYNSFTETNGFFEAGGGAHNQTGAREPANNILFAYNKIFNPKGLTNVSIHMTDDYRVDISNLRFENNTIVINNVFPRASGSDRRVMWYTTDNSIVPQPNTVLLKNNIFWLGSDVDKFQDSNRNNITTANNLFFTQNAATDLNLKNPVTELIGDPKFANLNGFDYHILADSPAINKGLNLGYTQDLDGKQIVGLPDIGAYESGGGGVVPTAEPTSQPTTAPTPTSVPMVPPGHKKGDVNNDGKVNIVDIGLVIDKYDQTVPAGSNVDLNSDGRVNIIDIGIIIDNYEL